MYQNRYNLTVTKNYIFNQIVIHVLAKPAKRELSHDPIFRKVISRQRFLTYLWFSSRSSLEKYELYGMVHYFSEGSRHNMAAEYRTQIFPLI